MRQYSVYLVNLDPTVGSEIKKTRPCVIISPDEMNKYLSTVIIAPMTTKSSTYPTRLALKFKNKNAHICLDQIRTIDKKRVIKEIGTIPKPATLKLKAIIREMLVD